MLVSHTKQFIYLKTTKTAGTSVEIFFQPFCLSPDHPCYSSPTHEMNEVISNYGIVGYRGPQPIPKVAFYNHMAAVEIKKWIGSEIWDHYFKFCVIRNPFDKI